MNEPSNADLAERIEHVLQVIADHSEVDLQAHAEAAAARDELRASFVQLQHSIRGLAEVWTSLRGLSTVLSWVGKFVKFVGGIALTLGALWAFLRYGKTP